MRVVPSEGSGRYSPGPGMVKLLEEMVLPGITTFDGDLFTQSARYPCYSLEFYPKTGIDSPDFLVFS